MKTIFVLHVIIYNIRGSTILLSKQHMLVTMMLVITVYKWWAQIKP